MLPTQQPVRMALLFGCLKILLTFLFENLTELTDWTIGTCIYKHISQQQTLLYHVYSLSSKFITCAWLQKISRGQGID